jgi:hypothetical protein
MKALIGSGEEIEDRLSHKKRQLSKLNRFIREKARKTGQSIDKILDEARPGTTSHEALKKELGIKTDKKLAEYIDHYRSRLTVPIDSSVSGVEPGDDEDGRPRRKRGWTHEAAKGLEGDPDFVKIFADNDDPFEEWLSRLEKVWFKGTRSDTNFVLRRALATGYFALFLTNGVNPFRLTDANFKDVMQILAEHVPLHYGQDEHTEDIRDWILSMGNTGVGKEGGIRLPSLRSLCKHPNLFELCLAAYMFSCGDALLDSDSLIRAIKETQTRLGEELPAMSGPLISRTRAIIEDLMLGTRRSVYGTAP